MASPEDCVFIPLCGAQLRCHIRTIRCSGRDVDGGDANELLVHEILGAYARELAPISKALEIPEQRLLSENRPRRSLFRGWLKSMRRPVKAAPCLSSGDANQPLGMMTVSMTWMTPLEHSISALVTVAPLTTTPVVPSTSSASPETDAGLIFLPATSAAITLLGITWSVRILVSFSLFSGLTSVSTVPAGSFANASSEGANTVNGPAPLRVSTSPAAVTAATSVLNEPAATAVSTMSCIMKFLFEERARIGVSVKPCGARLVSTAPAGSRFYPRGEPSYPARAVTIHALALKTTRPF